VVVTPPAWQVHRFECLSQFGLRPHYDGCAVLVAESRAWVLTDEEEQLGFAGQ